MISGAHCLNNENGVEQMTADSKTRRVSSPCPDKRILRAMRCGDEVLLSGTIFTGRDAFHKKLCSMRKAPSFLPEGSAIYHCGPIAKFAADGRIGLMAAGPTTSWRMGLYATEMVKRFKTGLFIGKGGMGGGFPAACIEHGAVYLSFPGGCAQSACGYIREVRNCFFLDEFGPAEAVYEIIVERMPLIATIDSHGGNLHERIRKESKKKADISV